MLPSTIGSVWAEPRVPDPPRRVWRDWLLVGVLAPTAVAEAVFRDDVIWRWASLAGALLAVAALLWRRTEPLLAVLVGFGSAFLLGVAGILVGDGTIGLDTTVCIVLLPYALLRWGSGREAILGLGIVAAAFVVGIAEDYTGVGDAIGAAVFLTIPAVVGATVRTAVSSRARDVEQARLREREAIARELHDAVAHHVSAIAVRAQAGRYVAGSDARAAADALADIENEATRALTEMRGILGLLREGEDAALAPQPGVDDLRHLADPGPPRVEVTLQGDLDGVPTHVGAALYRIAQEGVTNARRHARRATIVHVQLAAAPAAVKLLVVDDGEPGAVRRPGGFGLVGMAERAELLGGTVHAGPAESRGWAIDAVIPLVRVVS